MQHVDHRIPLQKLLDFLVLYTSGFDFRYLVGFHFLLAVAMCTTLVWTARVYRGYQSIGDLIIPLAGLHFAAGFTLWGFQFAFLSSTFLVSFFLWLIVWYNQRKQTYLINAAVLCLLLCSLCGLNGMIMSSTLTAALAAYFGYEKLRGLSIRCGSTYGLLASGIVLNAVLWRFWTPSGASNVHQLDLPQMAQFFYGLIPGIFVVYSFTDSWWKFGLVLILVLGAVWMIVLKIRKNELTLTDFVLVTTVAATAFLVCSISVGRAKTEGGWNPVLIMHYGYLTIFLPVVSWILVSSRLSSGWSNFLGLALVLVFGCAFYANAMWRFEYMASAVPHQSEILQQLASGEDAASITDKYLLDFTWKDEPQYRREVTEGIEVFRRKGFELYGPRDGVRVANGKN